MKFSAGPPLRSVHLRSVDEITVAVCNAMLAYCAPCLLKKQTKKTLCKNVLCNANHFSVLSHAIFTLIIQGGKVYAG